MSNEAPIQTLLGHESLKEIFLSRYQKNTMPHGWLLTGPQGIGKGRFAYHAAWFLLRSSSLESSHFRDIPFNDTTFRQMQSGSHPDFLWISPQGEETSSKTSITVDQIRKIEGFVRSTPVLSSWKVIIIDPADALNIHASNALLKVLEEPSLGVVFFLISHKPHLLLATIKSRCCVLRFGVLSEHDMEKIFPVSLDSLLQRFVQGRPGYREKMSLYQGEKLLEMIQQACGDLLSSSSLGGSHLLAKHVDKLDPDARNYFYDLLQWWIYQMITLQATKNEKDLALINEGSLKEFLKKTAPYSLLTAWEKILRLFYVQNQLNLDNRHVILNVFLILQEAFKEAEV